MIKCELESFIHYNHPRLDYVLPQTHSCYELVYYRKGHGRTTVNNEIYDYNDNDIVLIAPNDVHDEKSEVDTEVYCCLFNLEGIELSSQLIKYKGELTDLIFEKMKLISQSYATREPYFESYISSLIQQIMILIIRHLQVENPLYKQEDQNIRAIELSKKLMKEKIYINADLKIIAENIGYSYDYFRHIFKDYVGISPKQYHLEQKLNRAKQLLIDTNYSVSDIAKQCGFSSSIAFNDFFKNKLKMTPMKFRKFGQDHVDKILLDS